MLEELITAKLSSVAAGRRYWVRAPQGVPRPYVVLYRIDGTPNYHFCGRGTVASRVQANCVAETYTEAKALARDVVSAVDLWSDVPNGIQAVFVDSEGRDLPQDEAGKVTPLYGIAVDLIIHHN